MFKCFFPPVTTASVTVVCENLPYAERCPEQRISPYHCRCAIQIGVNLFSFPVCGSRKHGNSTDQYGNGIIWLYQGVPQQESVCSAAITHLRWPFGRVTPRSASASSPLFVYFSSVTFRTGCGMPKLSGRSNFVEEKVGVDRVGIKDGQGTLRDWQASHELVPR
uniref:Secreted protein n=1 Tax=Steinernema glaseri TaxID=37863 RepID=A0A1I7YDY3_9BILA